MLTGLWDIVVWRRLQEPLLDSGSPRNDGCVRDSTAGVRKTPSPNLSLGEREIRCNCTATLDTPVRPSARGSAESSVAQGERTASRTL